MKRKQDGMKGEKNEIRNTCKYMKKTAENATVNSKATLEAVKNRIGAVEDQIRDAKKQAQILEQDKE